MMHRKSTLPRRCSSGSGKNGGKGVLSAEVPEICTNRRERCVLDRTRNGGFERVYDGIQAPAPIPVTTPSDRPRASLVS
jgi:hypothetical protein